MKKVLLTSVLTTILCGTAYASDGGVYYETETETVVNHISYTSNTVQEPIQRPTFNVVRQCVTCGQPVHVKTYTEVIDHYQVYQPVTVYQPVGTYARRRIIEQRPCAQ